MSQNSNPPSPQKSPQKELKSQLLQDLTENDTIQGPISQSPAYPQKHCFAHQAAEYIDHTESRIFDMLQSSDFAGKPQIKGAYTEGGRFKYSSYQSSGVILKQPRKHREPYRYHNNDLKNGKNYQGKGINISEVHMLSENQMDKQIDNYTQRLQAQEEELQDLHTKIEGNRKNIESNYKPNADIQHRQNLIIQQQNNLNEQIDNILKPFQDTQYKSPASNLFNIEQYYTNLQQHRDEHDKLIQCTLDIISKVKEINPSFNEEEIIIDMSKLQFKTPLEYLSQFIINNISGDIKMGNQSQDQQQYLYEQYFNVMSNFQEYQQKLKDTISKEIELSTNKYNGEVNHGKLIKRLKNIFSYNVRHKETFIPKYSKSGDWLCLMINCFALNYKNKTQCIKCGFQRPRKFDFESKDPKNVNLKRFYSEQQNQVVNQGDLQGDYLLLNQDVSRYNVMKDLSNNYHTERYINWNCAYCFTINEPHFLRCQECFVERYMTLERFKNMKKQ